jgi:hypothetical protein
MGAGGGGTSGVRWRRWKPWGGVGYGGRGRGLEGDAGPIYSGGEAVGRPSVAEAGRCGRWPVRRVQRGALMAFRPLAAVVERRTRRGGT